MFLNNYNTMSDAILHTPVCVASRSTCAIFLKVLRTLQTLLKAEKFSVLMLFFFRRPLDVADIKDGSTIRYVSIFAKKYGTLVRYAFFVMVRVRYVGTLLN